MTTYTPTLAGFLVFVRTQMGITTTQLPDNSPSIPFAYDVAVSIVNSALAQAAGPIYMLAVYNLGGSNLINFAQDPTGQTFFADVRTKYNIFGFVSGVISSAGDEGTSESMVVQKAAEDFTLADLQYLKDPWGRQYLAFAQRYGTLWGIS
jgi:hypothetical protein